MNHFDPTSVVVVSQAKWILHACAAKQPGVCYLLPCLSLCALVQKCSILGEAVPVAAWRVTYCDSFPTPHMVCRQNWPFIVAWQASNEETKSMCVTSSSSASSKQFTRIVYHSQYGRLLTVTAKVDYSLLFSTQYNSSVLIMAWLYVSILVLLLFPL